MNFLAENAGAIGAALLTGLAGLGIGLRLRGKAPPSGDRLR